MNKKKIIYSEPEDYFPKEIREKFFENGGETDDKITDKKTDKRTDDKKYNRKKGD